MTRTGSCACGAIGFEVAEPFMATGACHCTDCRKASGGGPNYVALAPKEALCVTQGQPRQYRKPGESGSEVARAFCGDCGSPLWAEPASAPFLTIKVGAFDNDADLAPQMHVYAASAPSWHVLDDGTPAFPAMPPMAPGE